MKSIVLQNSAGDHLGHILCAIPNGQLSGECVFMIMPQKAELLDAPVVLELIARKELGESQILISADKHSVNIQSPSMDDMYIELDDTGSGTWGYQRGDGQTQLGLAIAPTK